MVFKNTLVSASLVCTLLASEVSHADWVGDFELGLSNSRGNTENTTVNAALDMSKKNDSWEHNIFGQFYYSKSGSQRGAENCFIGYKPSYYLTEKNYIFSFLRYGQDKYASIDHRTTLVSGVGRQIIAMKNHRLQTELGIGGRQTIYMSSSSTEDLPSDEIIYFLGGKYLGSISKTARFSETVRVEGGGDNTYIATISSLKLSIEGNLSANINYIARYNTDVTGDKGRKVDSLSSVTLVYHF